MDAPLLTDIALIWSTRMSEAVIDAAWSRTGRFAALAADGTVVVDAAQRFTPPVCPAPTSLAWAGDGRLALTDRFLGVIMGGGNDPRVFGLDRTRQVVSLGTRLAAIGGAEVWSLSPDPHGAPGVSSNPCSVDARCGELHSIAAVSTALVAVAGTHGIGVVDVGLNILDTRIELEGVLSVDVDAAGTVLAAGDLGGTIHVLRVGDETNGRELTGYPDRVRTLRWALGGRWLLASADDELTCWPVGDDGWPGDEPVSCVGHDQPITQLACTGRGDLIVTGDASGHVAVWSLRLLDQPVAAVDLGCEATSIAWSLDGSKFSVGTVDGSLSVYRVRRGAVA
jgi:WD40 repeat protein